jgi:integrase
MNHGCRETREELSLPQPGISDSGRSQYPLRDRTLLLLMFRHGDGREKLVTTGAIAKIMEQAGALADLPLPGHPHMLRHSCGYYLAEQKLPTRDIQEYLGHNNIQHTVRYTTANPARFDRILW